MAQTMNVKRNCSATFGHRNALHNQAPKPLKLDMNATICKKQRFSKTCFGREVTYFYIVILFVMGLRTALLARPIAEGAHAPVTSHRLAK